MLTALDRAGSANARPVSREALDELPRFTHHVPAKVRRCAVGMGQVAAGTISLAVPNACSCSLCLRLHAAGRQFGSFSCHVRLKLCSGGIG